MSKKYLDLAGLSSYDQKIKEYIDDGDVTIDSTLTQAGQAADAKKVGDEISDVKSALDEIYNDGSLSQFLYAKNKYINASGEETELDGYDLFRIPVQENDFVNIAWSGSDFWYQLNNQYVGVLYNETTYLPITSSSGRSPYYYSRFSDHELGILCRQTNNKYLFVCCYSDYVNNVTVYTKNYPKINVNDCIKSTSFGTILSSNNAYKTTWNINASNNVEKLASGYHTLMLNAHAGDTLVFHDTDNIGVNLACVIDMDSRSVINGVTEYVIQDDCLLLTYYNETTGNWTEYIPANTPKVRANDIIGDINIGQYDGLKGVAFGTSLTYRGQEGQSGGYLNYLPSLSGMSWDNQGVGSSTIYGSASSTILNTILNYASYADKDVVIIEGFVNDFYTECPLGNYTDTGTNSVCGCLRAAIAHILTQKKTATIFVVLDHYGKGITAEDVVKNEETQYTYYEECAKVCESMGVFAIKEYALSGINSYSDQFLLDNIHCNDLGAKQSAQTIWDCMKTKTPKILS